MGVHACGLVISEDPIGDWAPICIQANPNVEGKMIICTQYDGRTVEETGLMKMDFIILQMLSQLKKICERIKIDKGIDLDILKRFGKNGKRRACISSTKLMRYVILG